MSIRIWRRANSFAEQANKILVGKVKQKMSGNKKEEKQRVKTEKKAAKRRRKCILSDVEFNCNIKYSDEYYDEFMRNFKPNKKKRVFYRFCKRSFDMLVSLVGLVALSPLMLIIAIAIKIDSRGPIFFKQTRMGRHGKPFNCYKFRSMKIETPHDMATSVLKNPEQYYTKVGKFLRRFSLDELPQLWCSFWGTMSIIGPRPLVMTEEKCNGMRIQLGVYQMRPGISGYAQVSGRDDVYYKNKAIMDAEYVRNASLGLDIKLIFRTVAVVMNREGNAAEES